METRGTGPPPKNRRRAVTAVSPPWTPQPGGGQGLRPRAPPTSPSTVRHDEVVAGATRRRRDSIQKIRWTKPT